MRNEIPRIVRTASQRSLSVGVASFEPWSSIETKILRVPRRRASWTMMASWSTRKWSAECTTSAT